MEKNKHFMNEGGFFGMEIQNNELNSTQYHLSNGFFNPSWGTSPLDQTDPFESALSSMVSSPAASTAGATSGAGDNIVLRELIGRLGGICNSSEVSTPQSYGNYISGHNSTNNSCYTTPLSSPPKLNLSTTMMDHQIRGNQFPFLPGSAQFSSDPGFIERAARFSCFGSRSLGGLSESDLPHRLIPLMEKRDGLLQEGNLATGKKFGHFSRSSTPENGEFGDSHEGSSVSQQIPGGEIGRKGQSDGNGRKRKSLPRGKGKEAQLSSPATDSKVTGESEESYGKKSKSDEGNGKEKEAEKEKAEENGNQKQTKENSKPPEPPKDYIHVRARRGQATDSHSLAERVRREKISERMKFLQDLVPGCNKITGKAVMLDEIINYVQSLQRQVEFLSMKLATVNPGMEFNMQALLSTNIFQSGGSMPHNIYPLDSSAPALPYGYQSHHSGISNGTETPFVMNPSNSTLRRIPSMQLPSVDGFREAASQVSACWVDDLQNVVEMGFGQNESQSFPSTMATTHMKIEG